MLNEQLINKDEFTLCYGSLTDITQPTFSGGRMVWGLLLSNDYASDSDVPTTTDNFVCGVTVGLSMFHWNHLLFVLQMKMTRQETLAVTKQTLVNLSMYRASHFI